MACRAVVRPGKPEALHQEGQDLLIGDVDQRPQRGFFDVLRAGTAHRAGRPRHLDQRGHVVVIVLATDRRQIKGRCAVLGRFQSMLGIVLVAPQLVHESPQDPRG